jgi:hypothetical protein
MGGPRHAGATQAMSSLASLLSRPPQRGTSCQELIQNPARAVKTLHFRPNQVTTYLGVSPSQGTTRHRIARRQSTSPQARPRLDFSPKQHSSSHSNPRRHLNPLQTTARLDVRAGHPSASHDSASRHDSAVHLSSVLGARPRQDTTSQDTPRRQFITPQPIPPHPITRRHPSTRQPQPTAPRVITRRQNQNIPRHDSGPVHFRPVHRTSRRHAMPHHPNALLDVTSDQLHTSTVPHSTSDQINPNQRISHQPSASAHHAPCPLNSLLGAIPSQRTTRSQAMTFHFSASRHTTSDHHTTRRQTKARHCNPLQRSAPVHCNALLGVTPRQVTTSLGVTAVQTCYNSNHTTSRLRLLFSVLLDRDRQRAFEAFRDGHFLDAGLHEQLVSIHRQLDE